MRIEIWTWTVLAGIGVVIQSALVYDSAKRLRVFHQLGADDPDRRRVLVSHIRSGLCYLATHAIFFYIGLRVIIGFSFGLLAWFFILSALSLIYAGVSDWRDRRWWRSHGRGGENQ